MSPVQRANLGLLLLILGMGVLLWWRPGSQQALFPPITPIDPASVQSIRIYQKNRPLMLLKRQGDQWLSLPDGQPADPEWVSKLLHISQLPSLQRFAQGDADPARYGLAPPLYTLELDGYLLEFGSISPLSQLRYLRFGRTIHLISDGYTHYLISAGANEREKADGAALIRPAEAHDSPSSGARKP